MGKKIFLIVVPILLITAVLFFFGITSYQSKYVEFQSDGHFFMNKDNTSEKYYFDSDTKYKSVGEEILIKNEKSDNITIPQETFIHYKDGSISTFSKAVVLDLDELDDSNYKYYNIYTGTIFMKNSNVYSVNYLNKKLNFTNFLLKINNDKYMIIGKKMTLTIGETVKTIENNYLEITYLDGNIIKIENQELAYQSIDDTVLLELDNGVLLDLRQKNIYRNKEKKLSLGEITVNSDDNIQISSDDNNIFAEEETTDSEKDENSTGGNGNNQNNEPSIPDFPNVNSGTIDTSGSVEEIIDENSRIKDAEFRVVDMDVTANKLRATVQITDDAGVLEGDVNIKIIEYNTNRIVYEANDDSGSNVIDIENEVLSPETTYVLLINSDYKKNGVSYNKDFVQKTFITDSTGVELDKYYITEDSIQVNIKKSDFSEVKSVDVKIYDSEDKEIKTINVPLSDTENIVEFGNLKNNSKYKVKLDNFVYKDSVIADSFTIEKEYKTLKEKPSMGETSFTINKKDHKFTMNINNVNDPDNGIVSYHYEVYDARSVISPTSVPVTVIEKKENSSAILDVDDVNIQRGVPYIFRVVVNFNDNEKEYEYVSEYSEVMKLDGVGFPTIRFIEDEVTFNSIKGIIEITDTYNTMKIESGKLLTVIYTDSVGESRSFTSSGSLNIPVDVNNLRKNETYSFAVYGNVDLQDNNESIDSCYIGSIIVKTKDPNSFSVRFEEGPEDYYNVFSVYASLVNGSKGNASYEASTLTSFNVNLYSGEGTSGTLIRTRRLMDRTLDENTIRFRESDLKEDYYEKLVNITPEFFNLKNSDLTAEKYTIEITDAYDYTKYENQIPIENNYVIVTSTMPLPDLPEKLDDSVDIKTIRNRDMTGDKKREDLEESTIVGYEFKAKLDNSKKYAQVIHYVIHNADGEEIDRIDYEVPPSGEIEYSTYYIKDGLETGTADSEAIHRGQSFYITWTADMDVNHDGAPDVVYPRGDHILKSETLSPERQAPTFSLYPSTTNTSSYKWQYTFIDVDNTCLNKTIVANIDGIEIDSKEIEQTNTFNTVNFNLEDNTKGIFTISANYSYSDRKDPSIKTLATHYYEGIKELDFGKVAIYPDKNRVIFSFIDYEAKSDLFSKIASVKIDFISGTEKITLDKLSAKNGNITINYSRLESLMGKTITPVMTIYYDSGIYRFDTEGSEFAVQQLIGSDVEIPSYYYFNDNKLEVGDSADGSYLTFNTNFDTKKLTFTDKYTSVSKTGDIEISAGGITFNGTYISPKKLHSKTAEYYESNSFSFDSIIPGVSVLDDKGLNTVGALISTMSAKISTYGVEDRLQDNKVYLELYKSLDDTATNVELVDTYTYTVSDLTEPISVDNLLPETNYYFKLYGNVKKANGQYGKEYLYDIDSQREGVNYYFKTVGNVGINSLKVSYLPSAYDKKYFYVKYNLEQTIGFSYIKYLVYKVVDNENGEVEYVPMDSLEIENDTFLNKEMTHRILIPNTSGVTTGNKYLIVVQPVLETTVNGEDVIVELDSSSMIYTFNNLYKPYFSIVDNTSTSKISYRVNIRDYHKAVVNGTYQIRIEDQAGNDVTPSEYAGKNYSVLNKNRVFDLEDVTPNTKYTFYIIYDRDIYNDQERIENMTYTINSTAEDYSSVHLGNVYVNTSASDSSKIVLTYFDSDGLDEVKKIRYSIYDDIGFSVDNEINFVPTKLTSNDTSYYSFELPDSITETGIYYLSIQYLDANNRILVEDTQEYRYL